MPLVGQEFELDGESFECLLFVTEDGRRYCRLKDFACFLGYGKPSNAYTHIDDEFKIPWFRLVEIEGSVPTPSNWQPKTLFVTESGIYALVLRSKKPRARRISHQLFEAFGQIENMLAEKDETIAERDRMLADEMQQNHQLRESLIIRMPKVAVMPDAVSLRHTLCVYRQGSTIYKFIRTQKRNLENALRQIPEDSELVFRRENLPNSINIVNRLKEKLPSTAQFKYNTIITDAPVVDLIRECLEDEIDRPMDM